MTAHTHTHSAFAADRMSQGVESIGGALRETAATVGRSHRFTELRSTIRTTARRMFAALVANREAQALAEIEKIDWRLAGELRAAKDRAEVLKG